INATLRQRFGDAEAWVSWRRHRRAASMQVELAVPSAVAAEATQLVLEGLKRMAEKPLSEAALVRARWEALRGRARRSDSLAALTQTIESSLVADGDPQRSAALRAALMDLGPADTQAAMVSLAPGTEAV